MIFQNPFDARIFDCDDVGNHLICGFYEGFHAELADFPISLEDLAEFGMADSDLVGVKQFLDSIAVGL